MGYTHLWTGTAADKAKVLQNPVEIHLKGPWVVSALYSVLIRKLAGICCLVFTVYMEIYGSWTQLLVDMESPSSEVSWYLPFSFLYFAARRFILTLSMQPGQSERGALSTKGTKGQQTDPKPGRAPAMRSPHIWTPNRRWSTTPRQRSRKVHMPNNFRQPSPNPSLGLTAP